MSAPTHNYAYSSSQTEVGLAIQTPRTTAATTPTFAIPVKAPKYKPDLTMIPEDTLQGSMVETYNLVRGLRYDAHGWDSYPYGTSFGVFWRAELGSSDHKTAAGSATTLATAASIGATALKVAAAVAPGSWIVLGSAGTVEAARVKSATGSTKTLTLTSPLLYAHAASAAVTPLTRHTFSLLNNAGYGNQPPAVTLFDNDGEEWRKLATAQLDKLTLKGNSTTLVTYTCSWFANAATKLTSTPTISFTRQQPSPGWTSLVKITGTTVKAYQDWQLDFARGVKPVPALTGQSAYFLYFAGPLTSTGKLTVLEQSGSPQLAAYEAGTVMTLDVEFFTLQSGWASRIHSSKCMFKATGGIDRSKPEVMVSMTLQLLPTTTDALTGGVSPVKVTLANAYTSAF